MLILSLFLVSCDDDDDSDPVPTGSIMVDDQHVTNSMVVVSSIEMSDPGWVVIHRDNEAGGPITPAIISEPKYVAAGTSENVEIMLMDGETLTEDETIWVKLHTDTGVLNTYEFDTDQTLDVPISNGNNGFVMTSIKAMSPMLDVRDPSLDNGEIKVDMTMHNMSGWVVVHRDNGMDMPVVPAIISNPVLLTAGENNDIMISFKSGESVAVGEKFWVMLHTDTGSIGDYGFDTDQTVDVPMVSFDGNMVMTQITIQ